MGRTLIIAEHDGLNLNAATGKTLTAALAIDQPVDIAVLAADADAVAQAAASLKGVETVFRVERPENEHPLAAMLAPQIADLAARYSHLLMPSTTYGKDVLPRVAALLEAPQVSDVMDVIDAHTFRRPIYAGNVLTTVKAPTDCPVVATIRPASFAEAEVGGNATIEAWQSDQTLPTHTRFEQLHSAQSDRPDLQSAKRVVSGGRGVGSAENFDVIFRIAERLDAAVGASRAAVDAGYVSNELQVGQTGKIVAPSLYLCFGISGAIQHLTGIKDANLIVAVNKDPEAPIFEVADIGLVGDLFEVIPELEAALSE